MTDLMHRWARVEWHLAGSPDVTYETNGVRLIGDDPGKDFHRIRQYLADRYLKTPEAAPLVMVDAVDPY